MATMPRGEPRSVPDPAGEAYDAMIKSIRGASDLPTSEQREARAFADQKILFGQDGNNLEEVRAYVRHAQHRDDPVTWAKSQIGGDGYRLTDTAEEARGPLNNLLPENLRGWLDPKCNIFVWDALTLGGRPPERLEGGRIPVAGEWGDPKTKIGGYVVVNGQPEPGDVISNGHHVGIFAPLDDGRPGTISAATPSRSAGPMGNVVHNDWGFRGSEGNVVIRRYVGEK